MKSPNPKQWEEMSDGNLRYLSTQTHTNVDVLLLLVEEGVSLLRNRVQLAWRNKETGATAYWSDSRVKFIKPRVLSLSEAMEKARMYCRDSGMLLRIGITDEHEYSAMWPSRW